MPQYSILVDSSDDEEVEEIEDEFEDDLKYLRSLDPKVRFKKYLSHYILGRNVLFIINVC